MNESIENMIHSLRGQRVMLDRDLAILYGVTTKRLNEQFQRNRERFPDDFAFCLTNEEWTALRSQFATLDSTANSLRFQIGTLDKESSSGRGKYSKYLPHVFTEHGVVMLANVLRSQHAVKMSIEVVRAFIQMRKMLTSSDKFSKELHELKSFVLRHAQKSDQEFRRVWQAIEKLSQPPSQKERQIGFDLS
ncbi:MAG: ORF6N domain-containing protein [Patescibacteria group bacterium]